MNILFVTYGLPYPLNSGSRIREFNLIRNISRHHSVSLLSLLESKDEIRHIPELEKYCDSVDVVLMTQRSPGEKLTGIFRGLLAGRPIATHPFYYSELADKIRKVVFNSDFDVVQIEHSFLAPYIKALPENSKCRKIFSLQNIGVKQYRSMLSINSGLKDRALFFLKWLLMLRWEARYAGFFHHCLVVSPDESRSLKSLNSGLPVTVIDNGVDTKLYQPLSEVSDENTLLFTGTMGYQPNIDAVLYFCTNILPLIERRIPDVKLIVLGRYPSRKISKLGERENIVVTGQVSNIIPFYQKAKISIVPLRSGGGTRLKILESMALGRPVVSTTIGAEGLAVTDHENIIIADTPLQFAEGVIRLLLDKEMRRYLSCNARTMVEERYDWQDISQKLITLYKKLLLMD